MKILRIVLALALVAVIGASAANAGDIYLQAAGATTKTSNGCTKNTVQGTNFPVTTMDCTNSGTQEMFWVIGVPSDSDASWVPRVIWHANSTDTSKNACWLVSVTAIGVDLGGQFDITAADLDSSPATVTDTLAAGATAKNPQESSGSSFAPTLTSSGGNADCGGTNCRNLQAVVRLARDNSGSCTSNHTVTLNFDMLHLNY